MTEREKEQNAKRVQRWRDRQRRLKEAAREVAQATGEQART